MTAVVDQCYYPPRISPRYLQRLEVADLVSVAVAKLRSAGLHAEPSMLEPGGVVGGAIERHTPTCTVFERSFIISPASYGYLASVAGPGNLCSEWQVATLDAAIAHVLDEYVSREPQELGSR